MSKQKIDEKLMMTDLQLNHATKGFLQEIANEKNGVYLIIGPAGAGKTVLMNQYLKCFPQNVKKVTYCTSIADYSYNGTPNDLYITHENNHLIENGNVQSKDTNNTNIIIHDHTGLRNPDTISSIQELFMMSTRSNVAIISQFGFQNGISEFLEWFRNNPDFKMGDYSMLNRIKGITYVLPVHTSKKHYLSESLMLNKENIDKILETDEFSLEDVIESEIRFQGRATILDQCESLKRKTSFSLLEVKSRENENNPHEWADFHFNRYHSGKNYDKVQLARLNQNALIPTYSTESVKFSDFEKMLKTVKEEVKSDVYSIGLTYQHKSYFEVSNSQKVISFSDLTFYYNPITGNLDLFGRWDRDLEDDELLPTLNGFLKSPIVLENVRFADESARELGLKVADKVTVSIFSGINDDFSIHNENYPTNPVRNEYNKNIMHDRKKLAADYNVEVTDYQIG